MKRVIFVILLVLLTGCSVNYNITIDKNLSISESVTMCEKEDFFTPYYNSTKDMCKICVLLYRYIILI